MWLPKNKLLETLRGGQLFLFITASLGLAVMAWFGISSVRRCFETGTEAKSRLPRLGCYQSEMAYSTRIKRPLGASSGEKVLTPRSYSLLCGSDASMSKMKARHKYILSMGYRKRHGGRGYRQEHFCSFDDAQVASSG